MYKIVADLHTHSLACSHAYSTIGELITSASEKGLYALGITDHAKTMPGTNSIWYFNCLYVLPRIEKGVKVLRGIEANVLDFDGNTDLEDSYSLDYAIASIHNIPGINLQNPTIEKCTNLYMNLAKNPKINIIGHSGTPEFKYDYESVIPVFGQTGTLVEINGNSFVVRKESVPNCRKIAELCKKHEVPVVVNSDTHYHAGVGNVQKALDFLEEMNFPEELIVNSSVERLENYLKNHTNTYK